MITRTTGRTSNAPRRILAGALLLAGCGRIGFSERNDDAGEGAAFTWHVEGPALRFYDVHGIAPDNLFAVGLGSEIWHSTGDGTWTPQATGTAASYFGLHGTASALYAAGSLDMGWPSIVHSTGDGTWTPQPNTLLATLNKPWVVAPDDIYVVGYNGVIGRSTGTGTWAPETSGTPDAFLTLWASGPTDLYAAGHNGMILHSTGDGTWQPQTTGTTTRVIELWGTNASNIYAVGYDGMILHSSGDGTWQSQTSGVAMHLFGITGTAGDLYVAGAGPALLHSSGDGVWSVIESALPVTTADALWFDGRRLYVATDAGILVGVLL